MSQFETSSVDFELSLAMPSDYFKLMKPRVMWLVILTAVTGLLLSPGEIDLVLGIISILCIALGAGAAGVLNMWYDADIDCMMRRTVARPIPDGRVTKSQALNFGMVFSIFSVLMLGLLVNWVAGFLLAFTIFFYVVVYTMWLKRYTPQNIVIGGVAGSLPPMIGWTCVSGELSLRSLVLFAIIFIWTPPHFWALALYQEADYEHASIPMMPNIAGQRSTRNQMLVYSLFLAPIGILPWLFDFASPIYGVISLFLGLIFVVLTYRVWLVDSHDSDLKAEKQLFRFSIFYLLSLFVILLIEALAKLLWIR
ncbi:heme o synthase [Candidatus Endowatersipora endosymbiont of Watersipora subatra]|uniref:heme o synthase n=1 Tax=Candidatus Endowatersipora endosymbiont of Watersipora subatra TaxID=3077946 RepID=UPI00312C978D